MKEYRYPERDAARYQANREEKKAAVLVWQAANPDKVREYKRKNREKNREKLKVSRAAYRERKKQELKEKQAAYHAANPEVGRAQVQRRRARAREVFVENVTRSQTYARTGGQCHLCLGSIDFDSGWEQDHVWPSSRGGVHANENLAAAHLFCNRSKGYRIDFLSSIHWIERAALDVCTEFHLGSL